MLRVLVPTQPATHPAKNEFKPSYVFLAHLKRHFSNRKVSVVHDKKMAIVRYYGEKEDENMLGDLAKARRDFMSWSTEDTINPYFREERVDFKASWMHPLL